MRTWLLAGPVLGRGPRRAGCLGLVRKVVSWPDLPGGRRTYLLATVGTHEGGPPESVIPEPAGGFVSSIPSVDHLVRNLGS